MSHLHEFETEFTEQEVLVRALVRMGFIRNQIEVHEKAQAMINYYGQTDDKRANIIIRGTMSGKNIATSRADLGWERVKGTFVGHIDTYRQQYDEPWQLKLTECYNLEKDKMSLKAKGLTIVECRDAKGRLQLRAKFPKQSVDQMKVRL